MSDIDITLYLNADRVRALADALGDQTAETVEDKLTEAFDTLYQDYVPDELRATIEAKIEREDAAVQARLEADRRFAVTTSVKTVKTVTSQATISAHRCRLRIDTVSMSAVSCLPTPKPSPTLLLKRTPSALNTSARSVRISMQTTESLHCSNLIWTKVGSVFTTARIMNGRPTPCVIFPLRPTKRSARIIAVRNAAVRYSTAALQEKNLIFRKNHQMISQYMI